MSAPTCVHATLRALERYGLVLDDDTAEAILDVIRDGAHLCSWPSHAGRTSYVLDVDGRAVRVLYDPDRDALVTFLPPAEVA